jgi:hypothetical protein
MILLAEAFPGLLLLIGAGALIVFGYFTAMRVLAKIRAKENAKKELAHTQELISSASPSDYNYFSLLHTLSDLLERSAGKSCFTIAIDIVNLVTKPEWIEYLKNYKKEAFSYTPPDCPARPNQRS